MLIRNQLTACVHMAISKSSLLRPVIASILMLLAFYYLTYVRQSEPVQPRKPFSTFPKRIDQYIGHEIFFDQRVYDILGVDDSILVSFVGPEGREVELYVGFYQSQREGDLIHSPQNCLPGSGWNINETSFEELKVHGGKKDHIKVLKMITQKGAYKHVVLYWFQSRGRYICSEYLQKIFLVWDAILKNRTDGSFVRLIAPVRNGDVDHTTAYLKAFASKLIPVLDEYIPGA